MLFTPIKNQFKKVNLKQIKWPEDRAILLICMGIAFLFWVFIKLSQQYTARKDIRFQFVIPPDKTFVNLPPEDMFIELEGSGWDLMVDFFAARDLIFDYTVGPTELISLSRNRLQSEIRDRLYSKSLRIRAINYDGLNLVLEEKKEKKIPVRLVSELTFAAGYQLQRPIQLDPDSILISGPLSYIDAIAFWETDSLLALNIEENINLSLDLIVPDPALSITPKQTQVNVWAEQFTESSVFVPIDIQNAPDSSLRIFPNNISVSYIVGLSNYNKINAEDFSLIVDFQNLNEQSAQNTVPIQLKAYPDSIRNIQFSPRTASYFFIKDSLSIENQE